MSVSTAMEGKNLPVIKTKNYARLPQVLEIPNLIQVQLDSFKWFMEEGIKELLQEVHFLTHAALLAETTSGGWTAGMVRINRGTSRGCLDCCRKYPPSKISPAAKWSFHLTGMNSVPRRMTLPNAARGT